MSQTKKNEAQTIWPSFVRIAERLGLLRESDMAPAADMVHRRRATGTSADTALIESGYLTPEGAQLVLEEQKRVDLSSYLDDIFRKAGKAIEGTRKAAQRLVSVAK